MALWCGAGLAALLGVAALAVALAVYRPQLVRPWVQRALTPRGGTASLAGLRLSLTPPALELSGLAIAGPPREGDLLRLDHLRFELIPRRFFRGGPWLRHVEARGLAFERPRPRETKGPPDLTPLTRLFDIEDLSLTDARLRVALPQGDLAADGVRLSLIPGEGGIRAFSGYGELTFRRKDSSLAEGKLSARGHVTPGPAIEADLELASARLMLPGLTGDVFGQTRLRVTPIRFQALELTLTLTQGHVSLGPQKTENLGPIRLNAAASSTLEGKEPRLEMRELDIGGLLLARGQLSGSTLEEMSGTVDGEIPRVERVKTVLAPLLPGSLTGMDLTGRLPFAFRLYANGTARVLALELLPRDLQFLWPNAGLGCRFGGSLLAESPLQGWLPGKASLSGRLQGTGYFERPPLMVRMFRFDVPLSGEFPAPTLPGWNLSVGAGEVIYEDRPLPLGTLELRGSSRLADHSYRVEDVDIQSDSLGHLMGKLAFRGGSLSGRLKGASLPADNLVSLARVLSGQEWKGWSPTGAIDVAAQLEPAVGGSRVSATATLAQIGFTSPAGDVMGQKLAGRVDLEALLVPQPRMKADLVLRQGEALWGTVYADLAKDPMDLHAWGTRVSPEEYKDLVLEGGSAGFGRLKIDGKARHAGGKWRHQGHLVLSDARLGAIFRTFLRDPLAAKQRDLAGLEMDGAAELDMAFSGSVQAVDLAGTLRLRSGDVRRGAEPPLLSGLDLDLPIAYSLGDANPGHSRPSDAAKWGRLSLKKLRLAGQELGPLEMPAVLVPNHLYLGGTIDASLFGAKLSLRRIQVDEPLSPGFRITLAAQLDGLDLARVAGENSMLEGHLGGLLDPVAIGRERMTADGELTGDLFGGRLDVRHVTVERPFGAGREIGADVNVSRVDLERLSAALGVGRITGRLSGSVEGLRVAYGQPVAFHLTMESVPAKGVTQNVSLKAVNSISLVSTGSGLSGLGASLMTTFFKDFTYEKIGFECGLKNDVFTVRGLIHEDGVEYLVKRSFFGGINVINANPDNRIGFSDMLDRAKRVTSERSK
ncbi:MAG: hypothetical protein A2Z40_04520 [Deltaproteobacteria bacterium RBG_19FT_COMBO_60_16]|nr:MAG: hypothetical protein A2Z40_04520 [Deltaproteobacteria bacterium RBG_19FT_COMBO_60_16]